MKHSHGFIGFELLILPFVDFDFIIILVVFHDGGDC